MGKVLSVYHIGDLMTFMELHVLIGNVEKLKLGMETWRKCWLQ